jgi:hypothetical protein
MKGKLIVQLTCVIRLIAEYPQGLGMLMGSVSPPECEEINEMLETVRSPSEPTFDTAGFVMRVDGGKNFIEAECMIDNAGRFNRVIDRVGGWERINTVTQGWAKHYSIRWSVLVDYAVWVNLSSSRIEGSEIEKISEKHGFSRNAVYHTVQIFPQELATAIINWIPQNGELTLLTEKDLRAV